MAISYADGHPQWEEVVTHDTTDIAIGESEESARRKLTNIISGALKSPEGEFPLEEFYYRFTDEDLEIYDRNAAFLISVGAGNFTNEEKMWIIFNLPKYETSEEFQDPDLIKLDFKKWKNEWWNVFRTNGTRIDLIGYVRPLLPHLILPFDIESTGPTPRHYFEDRYDNVIVTEPERKVINDFIMRQVGDISVSDIYVDPDEITVYVKESAMISTTVKPSYATNTKVHVNSDDEGIAYVENGTIVNGQIEGECNIVVTSDEVDSEGNPVVTRLVPVHVIQLYEFVNTLYTIVVGPMGVKYITDINPGTGINEFLDSFRNHREYLHIYTDIGNEVTYDPAEIVQTGMYMDLIIEGNYVDHLNIVVPGDVNGDGLITSADLTTFNKHYSNIERLEYPYTIAADINKDGVINATDREMLISYINTGRF